MKAILIIFNQSISGGVMDILNELGIRGFTRWSDVQGQGSESGEPHLGTHVWPNLNGVILTVTDEQKVKPLFEKIDEANKTNEAEGIRAFTWSVEKFL